LFPFALKEQCEVVRTTIKSQNKTKAKQTTKQNKTKTNKQRNKREKNTKLRFALA